MLIRINGHSILLLEQTKSSIWTMDMHIGPRIRSLDCVLECGVLVRCCNDQITPIWLYLSPDWLRILVPTCPPYFPPPPPRPPRPSRHLRRDVTWSRFGGAGHSSIHTPHRAAAGPHFYNVRYSMGTGGVPAVDFSYDLSDYTPCSNWHTFCNFWYLWSYLPYSFVLICWHIISCPIGWHSLHTFSYSSLIGSA